MRTSPQPAQPGLGVLVRCALSDALLCLAGAKRDRIILALSTVLPSMGITYLLPCAAINTGQMPWIHFGVLGKEPHCQHGCLQGLDRYSLSPVSVVCLPMPCVGCLSFTFVSGICVYIPHCSARQQATSASNPWSPGRVLDAGPIHLPPWSRVTYPGQRTCHQAFPTNALSSTGCYTSTTADWSPVKSIGFFTQGRPSAHRVTVRLGR